MLSPGEQQRVGIARALSAEPPLIIADEPGNLDPQLSVEIMNLFAEFQQVGTTVLIASHDLHLIRHMGKRVLVLDHGRLIDDFRPPVVMVSRRNSSNRLREVAPATQLPRERRAVSARLQAWFEHHRGSFRSSLRRLRDRAWSSILTVLVMGIALALPFLLHVLLDNARSLSGGLQEAREIHRLPHVRRG